MADQRRSVLDMITLSEKLFASIKTKLQFRCTRKLVWEDYTRYGTCAGVS